MFCFILVTPLGANGLEQACAVHKQGSLERDLLLLQFL
jgi:hypothetical protein